MDRYEPVVVIAQGRSPPRTARRTSKKTGLARTAAACRRRTVYWAVAALLGVWWLLRFARKPSLLAVSTSAPSTFACHGDSLDTRRCVLHNVVVQKGVIYFHAEDALIAVPPMLCSMVNKPETFAAPCDVRVLSDSTAFAALLAQTERIQNFNFGLALNRLNPGNAYHLLFEDMIPAMALIYKASNITSNDPLPALLHTLEQQHWGLFLTDHHAGELIMDKHFWQEFYPEVIVLQPSNDVTYRVKTLLAGTGTKCVHWGHCQPSDRTVGIFDPPDAAVALRKVAFHRYGIVKDEEDVAAGAEAAAATPAPRQEGPPRVTLVQRSTTRRIRNLKEVEYLVKTVMGVFPRVVDMSDLSIKEQVSLAHNTDILILVHGGAMANLLWLPPGALIIDIYPHGFLISYHCAIMHWIRKALEPAIELGHMPFQVETAEGQELLTGPMREGCVCRSFHCQTEVFRTSAFITVDAVRFKEHLKEGLRAWREGGKEGRGYEKAITPEEFARRQSKVDREREARSGYYTAPVCWDET